MPKIILSRETIVCAAKDDYEEQPGMIKTPACQIFEILGIDSISTKDSRQKSYKLLILLRFFALHFDELSANRGKSKV